MSIPLSILDLAPVPEGTAAPVVVRRTVDLAQHGERLGYRRVWYAEHHAMPSVASSAPEILIANSAAATTTIHLGSGGIMLPNHSPLKVAENFHTLEALHPGRIDLGIGRAPGGVPGASLALRAARGELFAQHLDELQRYSSGTAPSRFDAVHAEPSGVSLPPIWLLGSSGASAQMAGAGGMGYSFAAHFSPAPPAPAMLAYRRAFQPSPQFAAPHAILGIAAICAPSEEEAQRLASTMELAWLRIHSGRFLPLPSPEEALAYPYNAFELEALADVRARTLVGTPAQIRVRIEAMAEETQADEVMIASNIYDHAARLRSYALIADAFAD
ncbi:LLM class flavin-dependent oxidoreductase [Solimonas marina]|uniref:Luciferase-like monooxygenase n=1 Tax=Solimonas marina TaxID=2714601 RepID=A0A969W781_9GAMM|nr:LLM class flavin-dependent oxidoreductase [Solimonas marina]NKF21223.1 LLM class flavin-dependent oxidoreductase [Solimonas marina]